MAEALHWVGGALIVAGALLSILGAVGVLRFPDVYTRIHAASLTDTGGATLMLLGMGFMSPLGFVMLKLLLVWGFIMLTSPAAANALANAVYSAGVRPRIGTFQIMGEDKPDSSGPAGPGERTAS
jgi:multicomponent Na+:H+ antiporter subunit G